MLWIKRNLFLSISGLLLVVFAVAGGLFLLGNIKRNAELDQALGDAETKLDTLQQRVPFPSLENIDFLQAELGRVTNAIAKALEFFQPVPAEPVTGLAFKTLLDNTIAEMRQSAEGASVRLPGEDYAFSFEHEKGALLLPATSFPALPAQLAEVKALCSILFAANINFLEGIRRPVIPGSGVAGSSSYHSLTTRSNAATGMLETPYELTFSCFSRELAVILESLYKSRQGYIVKAIQVDAIPPEPKGDKPSPTGTSPAEQRARLLGALKNSPQPAAVAPAKTTMETVIDERRLRVSLFVHVVKPAT